MKKELKQEILKEMKWRGKPTENGEIIERLSKSIADVKNAIFCVRRANKRIEKFASHANNGFIETELELTKRLVFLIELQRNYIQKELKEREE